MNQQERIALRTQFLTMAEEAKEQARLLHLSATTVVDNMKVSAMIERSSSFYDAIALLDKAGRTVVNDNYEGIPA